MENVPLHIPLFHFLNTPWSPYVQIVLLQMIVMNLLFYGYTCMVHSHTNHELNLWSVATFGELVYMEFHLGATPILFQPEYKNPHI